MIYAQQPMKGSSLGELLVKQGMLEENRPFFEEFMDMSKPVDYGILSNVTLCAVYGRPITDKGKYEKAVNLEIVRANNNELTDRFLCFLWAAVGVSCVGLVDSIVTDNNSPQKCSALFERALTGWLGREKARLCAEAFTCVWCTGNILRNRDYIYKGRSAEEYMQMGDIIAQTNRRMANSIYALALEHTDKADNIVKHIAKYAADIQPNGTAGTPDDTNFSFYLLMTELGRFDSTARAKAVMYAKHDTKKLTNVVMKNFCYKALDVIEEEPLLCTKYAAIYVAFYLRYPETDHELVNAHLRKMAKNHTEAFTEAVLNTDDPIVMRTLADTLKELGLPCPDINAAIREQAADIIRTGFDKPAADEMVDYINGRKTLEEVLPTLTDLKWTTRERPVCTCYSSVGSEDFFCRYYAVLVMADMGWSKDFIINRATGFEFTDEPDKSVEMLLRTGLHPTTILKTLSNYIDTLYSHKESTAMKIAAAFGTDHKEALDKVDHAELPALGRQISAMAYSRDPERYKAQLFAMAEDTSKAVKTELTKCMAGMNIWHDDIAALLTRKKASARELALAIIEKQGAADYRTELEALYEKEKSAKIKDKAALLLGAAPAAPEDSTKPSAVDPVEELTKGGKARKVAFAFDGSTKTVHNADGSECERKYLEALMMCYAGMTEFGASPTANVLAEKLNKRELAAFAADVFAKWVDAGAQAKTKWVLYFTALHGGSAVEESFMHYIKFWGENSRGAIASEAVRAMALSGSKTALMNVDGMSRKFKNKMVRGAAADALRNAAEELGLTTDELADKIVPDLGFDENMCREFDFGPRQFKVYLGAGNVLQIFNGDKQVKNLPKPAAGDDAEKAAAATADFKEMKKQLKTVAANQSARLESVLMNDRRWTAEGWKELFVKNAVMHGFAMGLIWGLYDDSGKLTDTFRYTEEGSFNSVDDDELTIPDNAKIGLVHPLELTAEQISAWKEQLEDYEITQPFPQLDRRIFRMTDEERKSTEILRFDGIELNSLSLIGKLTKIGWYKGQAEDAGFFYYFYREDISSRTRQADGSWTAAGTRAYLVFSGASIVNYDFEGEEVTVGKLELSTPDSSYYRYQPLEIGSVSERYFSELIMQLTSVLGAAPSI
ncbi:DUF4132 domain-containing protein [Ruminococcus sp.]|uniref:DUF4132 domain-containing protein n=1 Tax=Ruminococcus sp. TaxID=41978 RepID=UPI0025FC281F|nr:DUF4132 domain-containing protein [Ruminococcus sp.]MBQ8966679.1 DUF4132 domain-containing protein [Ruminococcus sp.]